MNHITIIGNLTRDPEPATTQSGINYCRFTLAVTRHMSKEKETDFINIVTWRGTADNCAKYLTKGSKVAVSGSLQTGSYEKDGQKRYTADVHADEVEFLNTKGAAVDEELPREAQAMKKEAAKATKETQMTIADGSELPF